jgi:hypothetical protein
MTESDGNPLMRYLRTSKRRGVRFAEKVMMQEFPKVEIEMIPELFYSKFDYRRFKSEEKFREERAVARAIRRLVGHAVADMDVRFQSCDDVTNRERELMNQSAAEGTADVVAVSSDEDSCDDDDDDDEDEEMHTQMKSLTIREEKVKARRRSSLLNVPSYKSHGFEDENIGLDESFSFIDKSDMAFEMGGLQLNDMSFDLGSSCDISFTPVGFDTVLNADGRPAGRPPY